MSVATEDSQPSNGYPQFDPYAVRLNQAGADRDHIGKLAGWYADWDADTRADFGQTLAAQSNPDLWADGKPGPALAVFGKRGRRASRPATPASTPAPADTDHTETGTPENPGPGVPHPGRDWADPFEVGVDEVVDYLNTHPEEAEEIRSAEAGGKARVTILNWQPPV